jgi:hypothetical protein
MQEVLNMRLRLNPTEHGLDDEHHCQQGNDQTQGVKDKQIRHMRQVDLACHYPRLDQTQ